MSLNVSYNQSFNRGVDSAALREVTQQIFKRAESKSGDVSNLDFGKFKKADLGLDLYNGKVNAPTARQIAATNSGFQVAFSESAVGSLKFLNAEASKSIFKRVDGKFSPSVSEELPRTKNEYSIPKFTELVKISDLNKDKGGSNPFYKGELLKSENRKKEEKVINIFA